MAKSMIHWNGDLVCAIDTETSGLDPHWNEILQIAVLPLDSNFERRSDVMPFYITLKPDYPERVSPDALRVCKLNIGELMLRGLDQEKAREVFLEWVDGIGNESKPGAISEIRVGIHLREIGD
jgi:DNA polymerase III epsilon subunit-like protein